ncbi:MAG: isocitrate lyase/PEP mutase family protein [Acidimicrobiia bacterium]|nr:isocitrate lyase/PEP mutase family protein [Acidimicrobiia bacterium]
MRSSAASEGAARLRTRLVAEGAPPVVAPFVYDGFQARLAQQSGAEALYVTGFGTAASHGLPDVGLLGVGDMVSALERVVGVVDVPVVCDADTGFGSPLNVADTVLRYARAGAAALHIEDQVWPKRCGFMAGKEVVPAADMVQKVRAAVEASGEHGPVIIARTDALASHGWDEAVERAESYREAGAELIFVDGIRSRRDAADYAERLGHLPLVYNGLLPLEETARLGFRLVLASGTLLAAAAALSAIYRELGETGAVQVDDPAGTFERINATLGLDEVERLRERYG